MTDTTGSRGPLGVAVIGYSFMGKAHSNAWRNVGAFHPGLQVRQRVLVGRNEAAVKEAADAFGWDEAAVDWRSVVTRDDIDIVDICTPGATHAEIARVALAAGKHVLVEKPVANTVAEAERMAAAAAARGGRRQSNVTCRGGGGSNILPPPAIRRAVQPRGGRRLRRQRPGHRQGARWTRSRPTPSARTGPPGRGAYCRWRRRCRPRGVL